MPSEPIEAEFVFPPALSQDQEDEYRQLEREGPLTSNPTATTTVTDTISIHDLEKQYSKEGYHLVEFTPGAGEDPREWSKTRKWCASLVIPQLVCFSKSGHVGPSPPPCLSCVWQLPLAALSLPESTYHTVVYSIQRIDLQSTVSKDQ